MKIYISNIFSFFFSFSIIFGRFFLDLIISLSAIFYIIKIKNFRNDLKKLRKPIMIFLIFYFIVLFCEALNNSFQNYTSVIFYFRHFVFSLFLFNFLKKRENLEKLIIFFYFLFLIIFIDVIVQLYLEKNLFGFKLNKSYDFYFVTSFFNDEKVLGSFISRFLPFIIAGSLLINSKIFDQYHLIEILILISFIIILLSTERVALFNFLIFLIFYIFTKKKKIKYTISIFTIFVITCFLSVSLQGSIKKTYITTINQINDIRGGGDFNSENKKFFLSKNHQHMLMTSIEIFKDSPLTGKGIKSFVNECKKYIEKYSNGCSTHPHNFYGQLLSGTGIFPFLILFMIFVYFCLNAVKIIFSKNSLNKYQSANLIIISAFIFNFFPLVPSGNFFNNLLSIELYISLPMYFLLNFYFVKKN